MAFFTLNIPYFSTCISSLGFPSMIDTCMYNFLQDYLQFGKYDDLKLYIPNLTTHLLVPDQYIQPFPISNIACYYFSLSYYL